jgi:hypothetical protein
MSGGKTSHSWVRRNCHREVRRTMLSGGKRSHSRVRRICHRVVRRKLSQRWVGENVTGLGQEKNVTKVGRRKCDTAGSGCHTSRP